MAVDDNSYQPKVSTGPQNLLDSVDTCDHGFIGCYREGDLTNSILRFLDSLELHSWRTKNYTFSIFEDDFVYFRKSTWTKLLDSFRGGMDIEIGNSRRDGVMIDFQLMIFSEVRKTQIDIASVVHKVRVIEIQVQMIENLLGENHSRTRYIMY